MTIAGTSTRFRFVENTQRLPWYFPASAGFFKERQMGLIDRIKKHEGYRRYAYRCTEGKLTIGYGCMIEEGGQGIPEDIAELLVKRKVNEIETELTQYWWFAALDEDRRGAIIEMAYQLGVSGLLKFKKMISALEKGEYETASIEALDSLWARQTPARARSAALIIRG